MVSPLPPRNQFWRLLALLHALWTTAEPGVTFVTTKHLRLARFWSRKPRLVGTAFQYWELFVLQVF
jgi:hypothetical protein